MSRGSSVLFPDPHQVQSCLTNWILKLQLVYSLVVWFSNKQNEPPLPFASAYKSPFWPFLQAAYLCFLISLTTTPQQSLPLVWPTGFSLYSFSIGSCATCSPDPLARQLSFCHCFWSICAFLVHTQSKSWPLPEGQKAFLSCKSHVCSSFMPRYYWSEI